MMRMSKTLRVLNIEEIERESLVLRSHLTVTGYKLVFERVDSSAVMRAALEEQECDVILADCALPKFRAMEELTNLADTRVGHSSDRYKESRERECELS